MTVHRFGNRLQMSFVSFDGPSDISHDFERLVVREFVARISDGFLESTQRFERSLEFSFVNLERRSSSPRVRLPVPSLGDVSRLSS